MATTWGLDEIESNIQNTIESLELPGLALRIIANGDTILTQLHGVLDKVTQHPVTEHSLFLLGSITKVFTSYLLMKMVDAGKLDLKDRVVIYLPQLAEVEGGDAITFQHLASHLSGLPHMSLSMTFPEDIDGIIHAQFPQIETLIEDLRQTQLKFPPRSEFAYSNYGIALLGHTLATIADKPYRDLIHDEILEPLGMNETCFDARQRPQLDVATGYITMFGESEVMVPNDIGGFTPAGQLLSTLHDMERFARSQWEFPSPVLSAERREQMQAPIWQDTMATGWRTIGIGDSHCVYHGGAHPGYVAYLIIEPKLRMAVILLTNSGTDPGHIETLCQEIMLSLLASLD